MYKKFPNIHSDDFIELLENLYYENDPDDDIRNEHVKEILVKYRNKFQEFAEFINEAIHSDLNETIEGNIIEK